MGLRSIFLDGLLREIDLNNKSLSKDDSGVLFYESSNPFEFFHILNSNETEKQNMFGSLLFPQQKKDVYPLVVCIHGSFGWRGHHHEHMVNFLKAGMAVFRVHSFEARNVNSVVEDQMQVTLASMISDAFNSLIFLKAHPKIDANRIAIAGWSLGGSTSLYSAWEPLASKLAPNGERFNAHLAFYPAAHIWPEDMSWNSAPILALTGEIDDYTRPILLKKLSEAINEASGSINAIYYPDSHHAFDSIEPVTYVENAITAGERHSYIDKDGNLYFENDSGERFLLNEPEQRLSLFNESKNIKGAHLGVNWEMRERSMKDAVDFLLSKI